MKTSYTYIVSHLLLMLIFSAGLGSNFVVRGRAHGVRIPEHWCQKLIHSSNCKLQKCFQECSKEPYGIGECKDSTCFCTYYCRDPPT
ncbi:hypothetical protein RIF29_39512 [Crotalaria pallida]|uniref:Uncharacterized protein n=1 Tax=Crotalaria pallida TaxID=3830 RepID=A0AAN9E7N2_CROPI